MFNDICATYSSILSASVFRVTYYCKILHKIKVEQHIFNVLVQSQYFSPAVEFLYGSSWKIVEGVGCTAETGEWAGKWVRERVGLNWPKMGLSQAIFGPQSSVCPSSVNNTQITGCVWSVFNPHFRGTFLWQSKVRVWHLVFLMGQILPDHEDKNWNFNLNTTKITKTKIKKWKCCTKKLWTLPGKYCIKGTGSRHIIQIFWHKSVVLGPIKNLYLFLDI